MSSEFNQIYFVWHPKDNETVNKYYEYTVKSFNRDVLRPVSRSLILPILFRTSINGNMVPKEIDFISGKSIIFCFSSKWVTGNDEWREYYSSLVSDNSIVIPVALAGNNSFNLNFPLSEYNFIREYDFNERTKEVEFLVSASQAIIKNLNGSIDKSGDELTTKLFLSHAKNDNWATDIAKSLKTIIDNTSLKNFFDSVNIHASFRFSDEIKSGISDSTVISIQSDSYSSRYWCQKEIHYAKEKNVPIIVVSSLKNGEDRIFPYSSNVPSIYVDSNTILSDSDAYRIIERALIETLKALYNESKLKKYEDQHTHYICRAPEPFDLKILNLSDRHIRKIVYPDPPVYEFESKLFNDFGVEVVTPLTNNDIDLTDLKIGISISDPSNSEMNYIGISSEYLKRISQSLSQYILFKNGSVVYGGDLRPAGHTEFIFDEAMVVQDRMKTNAIKVYNYLAWPLYLANEEELCDWIAKYNSIASFVRVPLPDEIINQIDNKKFLPPDSIENKIIWCKSLTYMRRKLIANTNARVCIGGLLTGYKGVCPGVLEEILLAIEAEQPIYLLGAFGGAVEKVCQLIKNSEVCDEFTYDWQLSKSDDYQKVNKVVGFNWKTRIDELKKFDLKDLSRLNGLSPDENITLFNTLDVSVAMNLIFKGLVKVYEK
ncbi:TIR domain-containing protein [Photobacterium damselae]|uniref:TIR domain-containing protein n=1 Tax=Photobacterium damselae TaxID=38293 RepID=UPI003C6E7562